MGMDLIQRAGGRQKGERITETLGRGLRSMTKDEIETDFGVGEIFKKYEYFKPAKAVPYRHDSILLILDATIEGINNFINTSDKE